MTAALLACIPAGFLLLAILAWGRYRAAVTAAATAQRDTCQYSLTDTFGDDHLINAPHQEGVQWLSEVFSRSAGRYPDLPALQIPDTGESLTFAELDAHADRVAAAVAPYLAGPDQVVAVAMTQDNWHIVAAHLGVLRAGGAFLLLDSALPETLVAHVLEDAQPVLVLTRGLERYRDLPTVDLLALPEEMPPARRPPWLDDPTARLATLFYTSGTTGLPKGVECPHAGYVNLALGYADYFDLVPGMDATTLTSSLGYDGSISEMYSAWVSGCAVVMLTREQMRSGPELVPLLREAEVTVLFCPPVLLTTMTSNPEQDLPFPICRYVVPAGEAFPPVLVEPWTRGRRQIINTYGPTEASTDTGRQSLRPGEPVTIGPPMPNVTYVLLEPGGLGPLPHGEVGELCIGGVHVARGYRNQPAETERKFVSHPQFGRLFRTGDRCRIDALTQRVHFLGRLDAQIKVRGHRVEVQGVEDILQTQFDEIESAVLDYQNDELVAFVAAPSISSGKISNAAPAPADWALSVTAALSGQLPAPSVPTRIFLVDRFVLKPLSGKIDRDRLPRLAELGTPPAGQFNVTHPIPDPQGGTAEAAGARAGAAPVDAGSGEVLAICRSAFETPLGWDDVFAEHGGHSIVIARLAHRLQAAGWNVPIRALLSDCNTARKVAGSYRKSQPATAAPGTATSPRRGAEPDAGLARALSPGHFTIRQALFLILLYAPSLLGFLALVAYAEIGEFFMTAYLWEFIAAGFLAYLVALALPFANLLWVMVIKLFLSGDLRATGVTPGVYPKWSRMHLRTWCVGRMDYTVLRPLRTLFRSAPLMAWVLAQLGASVGRNLQCAHDAALSGPLDLLAVGDDVAIQTGAYIQTSRWLGQELHIGPVHLQSGCKIGMRAAVANDVTVGRGSWITPLTPVLGDVGPGEIWEGAPARFSGRCTALGRTAHRCRYARPLWLLETLNVLLHIVLDFWLIVVPTAAVAWTATIFIPAGEPGLASDYFRVTPLDQVVWHMGLYALLTTWIGLVLISVLSCLFIRWTRVPPGMYPSRGLRAALLLYRVKRMNQIQRQWTWTITGQYLRALAGVKFPRIGAAECDLMHNLVPELVTADTVVFWSNGCFTNMLDYGAEHIHLRQLDMPANYFSGNNSVAEFGHFPTNFLLGVSTPGNDIRFRRQMQSRLGEPITVAGNPPLRFASPDFEAENAARRLPSLPLFLGRILLNDIFSIGVLRIAHVLVFIVAYTVLLRLGSGLLMASFLALILTEVVLVAAAAAVKKILVGSDWGRAHSTPFWSWRHFTYFFAQDCFTAWCAIPLGVSAGTVMSNGILRRMGCRIGKRTLLTAPLQAFDWNAVNIGDDCTVAGLLQFHTFENMLLKVKATDILSGSVVNTGATVMGGAVIEPDTTLLPLSLVMKEVHLPTAIYEGSPAEPAGADHCAPLFGAPPGRPKEDGTMVPHEALRTEPRGEDEPGS